jgi:hypothetical protein
LTSIGIDVGIDAGKIGIDAGKIGIDAGNVGIDAGNVGIDAGNMGIDAGSLLSVDNAAGDRTPPINISTSPDFFCLHLKQI